MRVTSPVLVLVVVIGGLCVACSPQPSSESAALEPYLLSVDEVGMGFTAQRGGQVSTSLGHLCPVTDVEVDGFGAVKALFTKPNGDEEIEIVEHLFTDSPETLDHFMADIKTAFTECDGVEWDYFGEKAMITVIEATEVGDDRIAVRHTDPTSSETVDDYTIYVRRGDVIAIIEVPENTEAYTAVVTKAINKLPG